MHPNKQLGACSTLYLLYIHTGWLSERKFTDNCPDFFALKEKRKLKKFELVGKMTEASCDRVMEEIRRKRIAELELVGRMGETVTVREK